MVFQLLPEQFSLPPVDFQLSDFAKYISGLARMSRFFRFVLLEKLVYALQLFWWRVEIKDFIQKNSALTIQGN